MMTTSPQRKLLALCVALVAVVVLAALIQYSGLFTGTSKLSPETPSNSWERESTSSKPSSAPTITVESPQYKLAVSILREVLRGAKAYSPKVEPKVKTRELDELLILDSTIVNETTLVIGNTTYEYVVIRAWDHKHHVQVDPEEIVVDDILIKQVPRNKSVTTTGGTPFNYVVHVGNRTCHVTFYYIGFMVATGHLSSNSINICDNVYKVSIIVSPDESYETDKGVFLLLLKK